MKKYAEVAQEIILAHNGNHLTALIHGHIKLLRDTPCCYVATRKGITWLKQRQLVPQPYTGIQGNPIAHTA
jgi:hypothetical protein